MPISNSSNHKLTVEPTGITCSCGYENVPSRKLTDGETRALAFQHLIDVQAVSPRIDSKGAREFVARVARCSTHNQNASGLTFTWFDNDSCEVRWTDICCKEFGEQLSRLVSR